MRYLITGSSGQLARCFAARFEAEGINFSAPPESSLDVTNQNAINAAVEESNPDVILNCAAFNAVDAAENYPAPAMAINSTAVGNLAEICKKYGCFLVHYGTDYVFDGKNNKPYVESDVVNPINEYGKSKLAGEQALANTGMDFLLLRVSWVYGHGTQNFLYKMQKWAQGKSSLKVVSDQTSVPTYTEDIVTYTLKSIEADLKGLYHLTNSGYAARNEVASFFFKTLKRDIEILPADSAAFPSPASRPVFSAMDNTKLSQALGLEIPSWEDAIERFCKHSRGCVSIV